MHGKRGSNRRLVNLGIASLLGLAALAGAGCSNRLLPFGAKGQTNGGPALQVVTLQTPTATPTATATQTQAAANSVLAVSDGAAYDFGVTYVGGANVDHTFTLSNQGGAAIAVNSAAFSLGSASPFALKGGAFPGTGGTCISGSLLQPSASCTVVITLSLTSFAASLADQITFAYSMFVDQAVTLDEMAFTRLTATVAGGKSDATLGTNGLVSTGRGASPVALAIDSQGRYLVAGSGSLLRLTSAGVIDATFGSSGSVGVSGMGEAIAFDGAGNTYVLTTGSGNPIAGVNYVAYAMLYRFGESSSVPTAIPLAPLQATQTLSRAAALAVDSSGNAYIGGTTTKYEMVVLHVAPGASILDTTFGGSATPAVVDPHPVFGESSSFAALALDGLGHLFGLGGYGTLQPGGLTPPDGVAVPANSHLLALTFGKTASADTGVGGNGTANLTLVNSFGHQSLAMQPDGKLVVATLYQTTQGVGLGALRLKSDGTPDSTFNGGAVTGFVYPGAASATSVARAVVVEPNGKILVAGEVEIKGTVVPLIGRFNGDGSLDTNWNGTGYMAVSSLTSLSAITTDSAGRVSAVGNPLTSIARWLDGSIAVGLTISDGPTYDYGAQPAGGHGDHTFTITNTGTGIAYQLGTIPALAGSAFSFKDGAFPGTGGSCGTQLSPGQSCTAVVTFAPTAAGTYSDSVVVTFSDQEVGGSGGSWSGVAQIVSRAVTGTGN